MLNKDKNKVAVVAREKAAFVCALFFIFFTAALAISEDITQGGFFDKDRPVQVDADFVEYDRETETYVAEGDVVVTQDNKSIKSDKMRLDMGKGRVLAEGNVEAVDSSGNRLFGDKLDMNIDNKTGLLVNGRLFFKQGNVHVQGPVIEKVGPRSYKAASTTYTTCDCEEDETPPWSIFTTSSKVTLGKFLTGWNALFYVKKAPVLYFPFIAVPVNTERQTGLLIPQPGYSSQRGFVLKNAFFWAITDSADATFYLDVETRRGLGEGGEFRYFRTKNSYGELFLYHFRERDLDRAREHRAGRENLSRPESANNDRWEIEFTHREKFDNGIDIKADVDVVSDDEYLVDFGQGTTERSMESLESSLSISKNWSKYSLVTEFRWFDNLLVENDEAVLQRLPEVTFTSSNQKIGPTPFYFELRTVLVNFERDVGVHGLRLDIQPTVSLPLSPGNYFDLTFSFTPRWTTYRLEKWDPSKNREPDRGIYEFETDITTTFVRLFKPELATLKTLMHTIRPRVTYTYIPDEHQDALPYFDSVDRVAATNKFTYSINSTLTGKLRDGDKMREHDYLYMDVSQSYDIEEVRRDSISTQKRRPFSDVVGEIILKPTRTSSITGRGKYDVYDDRFNRYDGSLKVKDLRGDSLAFTYRYERDPTESLRYMEVSARVHVARPIDLTYTNRYSFIEDETLESTYGMEYSSQCWGVTVSYSERLDDKLFLVTFNLKGLGKVFGVGKGGM